MSGIRVTYSGLISFIIGIVSVFTGLVFTLIVTRQLSQEEFGTWALIGGLTTYALILRPLISFWSVREIARGEKSGKTAILSTNLIAIIGIMIYLVIAFFFGEQTDVDQTILLFAAILIPVEFVRNELSRIAQGSQPQVEEYGAIAFELTKIPIALVLIYFLDMGLIGLIITSVIATCSSITILLIRTFDQIRGKFNKKYLKKWLKLFWIPMYPTISQIIKVSDVAIFTIFTGSPAGLAYWAAAMAISRFVNNSAKMGKAVYPKLLSGAKKDYFEKNLTLVFYFAFPLSAMSLAFAKPALFTLNPIYDTAVMVIVFLIPMIFLRMLSDLFRGALAGIEKVDTNENSTFKDYIKSKLFFLPTLENIQRGVYLGSLIVMLMIFVPLIEAEVDLVMYLAIVALSTQIPYTIYLYLLVKKEFRPKLNVKPIFKYLLTSVFVFSLTFVLMEEFLEYKESIFEFLPEFLKFVALGAISYFAITYMIDSKTKTLFKSVIKEIKNKSV